MITAVLAFADYPGFNLMQDDLKYISEIVSGAINHSQQTEYIQLNPKY